MTQRGVHGALEPRSHAGQGAEAHGPRQGDQMAEEEQAEERQGPFRTGSEGGEEDLRHKGELLPCREARGTREGEGEKQVMQPRMGFQPLPGLPCRACAVGKIQVLRGGFGEDWSELLHPRGFCDMASSWYVKKTSTGEPFQKSSACSATFIPC